MLLIQVYIFPDKAYHPRFSSSRPTSHSAPFLQHFAKFDKKNIKFLLHIYRNIFDFSFHPFLSTT